MANAYFRTLLLAAGTSLVASGAFAQTNPPSPGADDQNSPKQFDAQSRIPGQQNQTLSDRLDRSNGVIRPPAHVDPEIHESPPPTGDKMVVPAPGAGGDPTVKPK